MVAERKKEAKQMKSTFEEMGGTYRQAGDYLLPNVEVPESPAIGIWGQRRHKYLMEHNHALYTALFLSGKLTTHLEEIDRVAIKMYDRLVEQLKERDGITEELKSLHQMDWVRCMSTIRSEAEIVVMGELIYD
jgi:hypothetical protein